MKTPRSITWTLQKIKDGMVRFHTTYGRYPTAHEVDDYQYLPSSRQIQRAYGGLVALRAQLKLPGQINFTTGAHSTTRARTIGTRANRVEKEIYLLLIKRFGHRYVHREFMFTDDRRTRTDFYVYCAHGNFSIDVFYPKDTRTLVGCLNSKLRTYHPTIMLQYPVIFLMMNPDITEEDITQMLARKKNRLLHPYQKVMTRAQFDQFLMKQTPLRARTHGIG